MNPDPQVFVLSGADEALEALEDHQMQLQSMAGMGKFVDFFRQEVRRSSHARFRFLRCVSRLLPKRVLSSFLSGVHYTAPRPDPSQRQFAEGMRDRSPYPSVRTNLYTEHLLRRSMERSIGILSLFGAKLSRIGKQRNLGSSKNKISPSRTVPHGI